ncbi:TIGR01906 family membrane protein [Lacticaseibacillus hulanensis]|uniref:TIGR01906 family membrane protein n=1 Tax=Lacticaseibacillus hulanensis TaxID=2493111 RepID=UPI001F4E8BD4|nr:TIGR01906 family membrane protein [Lacticaseibacillus hulanensis]
MIKRASHVLAFWLFLISATIFVVTLLSLIFFPIAVHVQHLADIAGMSAGKVYHNYVQLMAYLYNPFSGDVVHLDNFIVSGSGARHFADVRNLFVFDIVVMLVTAWPTLRYLRQLTQKHERYELVGQAQWGILVSLTLVFAMALNFNAFFIAFHKVLFRNNDWLFDPRTDPIINVLPEDFFAICFVLGFAMFLAVLFWLAITGKRDAQRK